jgi:hypothetical protein
MGFNHTRDQVQEIINKIRKYKKLTRDIRVSTESFKLTLKFPFTQNEPLCSLRRDKNKMKFGVKMKTGY